MSARPGPCGGHQVTGVPTAINNNADFIAPFSLLGVAIPVMKVTDREAGGFSNSSQEALKMSTANCARLPQRAAMNRTLVWIEQPHLWGFGCSECSWVFNPSGSPTGNSFDEMMRDFELQRDQEFTSHVCADHLRNTRAK